MGLIAVLKIITHSCTPLFNLRPMKLLVAMDKDSGYDRE